MASYNRIIMMGNLTRDPEYKQLQSGQTVCRLGLASNRQFRNRQSNEMVQEVCFIDIDVWGPQADSCNQYLQKGRSVLVEGRIKLDSWQDNEGNRRSKHSIVADRVTFLSSANQEASSETSFSTSGFGDDDSSAQKKTADTKNASSVKVEAASAPQRASKMTGNVGESAPTKQTTVGEVAFKDQEPFEDDLPF